MLDPDNPLAKAMTVSLVLVSPSTYRKTVSKPAEFICDDSKKEEISYNHTHPPPAQHKICIQDKVNNGVSSNH